MEDDKARNEKVFACVSLGVLAYAFFIVFVAVAATAFFPEEIEQGYVLWGFIASITSYPYVIFFVSFVLIMILKELFISAKKVTLAINLFVSVVVMAYILIYPIIEIFLITRRLKPLL